MRDPETLLITDFVRRRLAEWGNLDVNSLSRDDVEQAAAEASCLKKLFSDYREEGLDKMIGWIVRETDAERRLERFLNRALHHLGPPGERDRFYLYGRKGLPPAFRKQAFSGGEHYCLDDYIRRLESRIEISLADNKVLCDVQAGQGWRTKTETLMSEMVRYLFWLVARLERNPQATPVVLLRDTLVIHLGLRWLRRKGWQVPEPKALLFNRAFANNFGPPDTIYNSLLVDGLCHVVHQERPSDLAGLRKAFARRVRNDLNIPQGFVDACTTQLDGLALDGTPLFIESGVNGTFPNWLLTLSERGGDMALYATVPWLYQIYRPVVFRRNYNYVREMETVVAHEHLFQIVDVHGGAVSVAETTDDTARDLALYELTVFRRLLESAVLRPCESIASLNITVHQGAQGASRLHEPVQ